MASKQYDLQPVTSVQRTAAIEHEVMSSLINTTSREALEEQSDDLERWAEKDHSDRTTVTNNLPTSGPGADSGSDRTESGPSSGGPPGAGPGGPPVKRGFFSSHLKQKRILILRGAVVNILIMGFFMMGIISIYWASFYKRNELLRRVKIWIVDADNGSLVGTQFTTYAQQLATELDSVQVEVHDASQYTYDNLLDLVVEESTWGVFYIHDTASSNLLAAFENPATTGAQYNSSEPIEFIYSQARDQLAMGSIVTWVNEVASGFRASFALSALKLASQNYSIDTIISEAPVVITSPVIIEFNDLRPFDSAILMTVTQVGLIFLIIVSFFQFNFFQPTHMIIAQDIKPVHFMIYRLTMSWIAYFFLSLFYSFISLAFQLDFTKKYGHGGFVIFWMLNWLTMVSVGLFLENAVNLCVPIFPPFLGFILILTVIGNIAPAFYSIPLQHHIFRYGYGLPIKNLADATRTIMFNTRNSMGRNVGVIIAWIVLDHLAFPLTMRFFGLRMRKKAMAEAAAKNNAGGPPKH
ncbi:uncharacterized protein V1516DRAFT_20320 [Lipomyces oligophaga]|uniref:uncharacterized protein n=1 Tax=Lipomyces oligophaga TaxID=45792 RepID=UPI0034CD2D06